MSEEILAGRNSVTEALRSGRSINKLLVQDGIKGGSVSEIIGLAKTAGVVLEFCKAERLDKLADGLRHQGFVALAAPIRFHSLEEVLALAKEKDETPFLLLLDELQDPQNVGALIRTADAAGVQPWEERGRKGLECRNSQHGLHRQGVERNGWPFGGRKGCFVR